MDKLHRFFGVFIPIVLTCLALSASANVESLDEWTDWVAQSHADRACPWLPDQRATRQCVWPGRLVLDVSGDGLKFTYTVDVYADGAWLALPGDASFWPIDVHTQSSPAAVLDREGLPFLMLPAGRHTISGRLDWSKRPAAIPVPESVALITLRDKGESKSVVRHGQSVLLDQLSADSAIDSADALRVEVFRLIGDGVPVWLTTELVLSVSGQPREIVLGQLQWPGLELVSLTGPLPARVEANGDLRVQVVPGRHAFSVEFRFLDDPERVVTRATSDYWPSEEYISFDADNGLRETRLSGVPSLDTSQLPIPEDWKHLPTYALSPTDELSIATTLRGDQSPLDNQLNLRRDLWLDFDGEALTGVETFEGRMNRDWRLNAGPGVKIGRAVVSGQPVMVTTHEGAEGVEIRSAEIAMQAITRIADKSAFGAVGWLADADSLSARLHLPPGWRVLHASGVDSVRNTWVSQWNLWGIFLVMIMVAVTRKVLGSAVAALSAFALVISYHETGVPLFPVIVLLILVPLVPILKGRLQRFARYLAWATSALGVVLLISFAVVNFRSAVYPGLEPASRTGGVASIEKDSASDAAEGVAAAAPGLEEVVVTASSRQGLRSRSYRSSAASKSPYGLGENDRVQTGPGIPRWAWNVMSWRATGPVTSEQQMSLIYSPPWMTSLWRVVSVLSFGAYLLLLVAAVLQRTQGAAVKETALTAGVGVVPVLLLCLAGVGSEPVVAQDYPPKHMLDELERRLLKPPACLPHCAALSNGVLRVSKDSAELSFDAVVAAQVVIPLPTPRQGAQLDAVEVQGQGVVPLTRKAGNMAITLPPGLHRVTMRLRLIGETVALHFPKPIRHLRAESELWRIGGLIDGRVTSGSLTLESRDGMDSSSAESLTPNVVRPFVLVRRVLDLGSKWRLQTVVERVAPNEGSFAVSVPLVDSENPLTRDLVHQDGVAQLQFAPGQDEVSWESDIAAVPTMTLVARQTRDARADYVETWWLLPSALWRFDYEGIPPIKNSAEQSASQHVWQPWPSEQLTLNFSRPQGVTGSTYTVQHARLHYVAGNSVQKSHLSLEVLSSLGQDYELTVPEDAEILAVEIDGEAISTPSSNVIQLPLRPGEQTVTVEFQQHDQPGLLNRSPTFQLPGGASNVEIEYVLPADRWPLYISGPAIGPAMLYWGVFLVIVLGALGLSYLNFRLQRELPVGLGGWILLGLGLSTVNSYGVLVAAVFFFAMSYRRSYELTSLAASRFNLIQGLLAVLTLVTLLSLLFAIPEGLLSSPEMLITGNHSYGNVLRYFHDRYSEGAFPQALVVSADLLIYRAGMLLWSLWLANRLIVWAQWWWQSYSAGGVWRSSADKA